MKIVLLEKLIGESGSSGRVSRPRKNTAKNFSPPPPPPKKKKKPSGGGGGGARARVAAVVNGAPDIVVKISGFSKGGAHAKANLSYISRHGEELETERGEVLTSRSEMRSLADSWSFDIDSHRRGANQRDTMHLILAPPGTSHPVELVNATRRFAAETFGNHEYVFALHTNTEHHHCHLTVKCRGFDGKQLHIAKGDPQLWREAFAAHLRAEGVPAEATPRYARGVTRRPEKQALRHIDDPQPEGRAPRTSRVRRQQFDQALAAVEAEQRGEKAAERPWEAMSRAKQADVRQAWQKAATALENTPQPAPKGATFKGIDNERPVYGRIDGRAAGVGQLHAAAGAGKPGRGARRRSNGRGRPRRADPAAVRESDLDQTRGAGRGPAAEPQPSVRDMPGRDVVHDHGGSEMLLLPHALHDVGGRRPAAGAGHALRRSRAGVDADGRGPGQPRLSDAELAAQMRRFAADMPPPVTQHERIKSHLRGLKRPVELRPVDPRPAPPERGPER